MKLMKSSLTRIASILYLLLLSACGNGATVPAPVNTGGVEEIVLPVEGMVCMACVGRVNRTLGQIEGVQRVDADLLHRTVHVWVDGESVAPEAIAEAIREMGYRTSNPEQEG